jgi:hypothetical protein
MTFRADGRHATINDSRKARTWFKQTRQPNPQVRTPDSIRNLGWSASTS